MKTIVLSFFLIFTFSTYSQVDEIVEHPDVEAEFKGGMDGMMKFIQQNLVYPEKAIQNNVQGNVYVKFYVDKKGRVQDVSVERGVSPELDAESIRVVEMMPNWIPGKVGKKSVKTVIRLPIAYRMD